MRIKKGGISCSMVKPKSQQEEMILIDSRRFANSEREPGLHSPMMGAALANWSHVEQTVAEDVCSRRLIRSGCMKEWDVLLGLITTDLPSKWRPAFECILRPSITLLIAARRNNRHVLGITKQNQRTYRKGSASNSSCC